MIMHQARRMADELQGGYFIRYLNIPFRDFHIGVQEKRLLKDLRGFHAPQPVPFHLFRKRKAFFVRTLQGVRYGMCGSGRPIFPGGLNAAGDLLHRNERAGSIMHGTNSGV